MKNKIFDFIHSIGIEKCGIAKYENKYAIVCLFPYLGEDNGGNLSLYARGYDYHNVIKEKLSLVTDYIKTISPSAECESFSDIGPEIDRHLAYSAGLGFYGKNRMLINDDFGSYFFIGYILTDLSLPMDKPLSKSCIGCNKCIESCAGGALGDEFCLEKCASHISQKKGDLTENEIAILKRSNLIFGCDICQKVCPHNNIAPRPMKEFTRDMIHTLYIDDIENLSNKEFLSKYKNRAFSWRGKNVLLRNINILQSGKRE